MSLMLKEIHQQPTALKNLAETQAVTVKNLAQAVRKHNIKYVVIAARGTSDHAAAYMKYLLEIENGIPAGLSAPSVHTLYNKTINYTDTLVVGISQSGEGPDVIEVLKQAKASGALTAAVTNNPNSSLSKHADFVIALSAGEEESVAATKTYTSTLGAAVLISECLKGVEDPGAPVRKAADCVDIALKQNEAIAQLAERYRFMNECVVLSRGINLCTASEAALKMIETCLLVAKAYSTADFLHGPIALMSEGFPALLYAPEGKALESMKDVASKIRTQSADLLIVSSSSDILQIGSCGIKAEFTIDEIYSPIPYIVFGQLFACHLACSRGYNPDLPRGLNKVTKTL